MNNNLILIICIFLLLIAVFIWQYRKFNKQKALNLPKEAPRYNDDSIKSAKAIGHFLKERSSLAGVTFKPELTNVNFEKSLEIYSGSAVGVIALCRVAHRLGCEVVVREITENGLDEMKSEKELQTEKESCEKEERINEKLNELGI